MKKIVYIDMDKVLVDFQSGIENAGPVNAGSAFRCPVIDAGCTD